MSVPAPIVGQVFGHYRLIEQIGAGGMGVVFRAHDEQLRRDVAVKILPHDLFADAASRERFRKEALAVGRLNHPNIAMAFDFGEQNGVDYLVTEYIPGLNLDEKIDKQPLPQKSVLELGIQMVSGLEAAHREKVVHRDLKPANIRLNRDGQLKILDFGLAKLVEPFDENAETVNVTSNLSVSGTLPYMAPELLRAEDCDARADIWAAGAVLYEMATGKRSFPDKQPSLIIDAILHYDPVRPTLINPVISASLEAVILKALDRDPNRRYQSALEMRVDLQRLLAGSEIATDTLRQSQVREVSVRWRQRKLMIVLPAVLVVGLVIGYFGTRWARTTLRHQDVLAVLPIETVGHDAATNALGLGLTETLTSKLVQASKEASIQVVSLRELRARGVTSASQARREFGTDLVLEGSLQEAGGQLRIIYNLVDSKTGRELATRTITTEAGDIFGLQDQVVTDALDMLPGRDKTPRGVNVRPTLPAAAYEAYIRGRGYLQEYEKPENIDSAITEFTRTVEADPGYAPAYAGLGQAYWLGFQEPTSHGKDWLEKAAAACQKAMALDPKLPDAYACLGNVALGTGRYEDAVVQFQKALDLNPNDDYTLGYLADTYQKLGKPGAAEAAYKNAIALRPTYWAAYNWLGAFYADEARYSEAAEMFRKAAELAPDNYRAYSNLGGACLYEGKYAEAEQALLRSIELRPTSHAYGNLGVSYYYRRQFAEAIKTYEQAMRLDQNDLVNWGNLGDALYWLGRRNEAADAYKRALALAQAQAEVNSRNSDALAYIGEYAAMLEQKERAITSAQRAIDLNPKDATVMFRAALVYNHFGDRSKTLYWLEKAIQAGASRANTRDTPDFDSLKADKTFQKLIG